MYSEDISLTHYTPPTPTPPPFILSPGALNIQGLLCPPFQCQTYFSEAKQSAECVLPSGTPLCNNTPSHESPAASEMQGCSGATKFKPERKFEKEMMSGFLLERTISFVFWT